MAALSLVRSSWDQPVSRLRPPCHGLRLVTRLSSGSRRRPPAPLLPLAHPVSAWVRGAGGGGGSARGSRAQVAVS